MTLLAVEDLRTTFPAEGGRLRAVDGVSFAIEEGETLGLVGESGAGKSAIARSLVGLVEEPGRVEPSSSIRFRGRELVGDEGALRDVRGSGMTMVFQEPGASLDPVYTVGNQLAETIERHRNPEDTRALSVDLLRAVDVPDPRRRLDEYPHQLSGGQQQRVAIALALACDPDLLVLDEPTTALDVTTQASILDLLDSLREDRELSTLFITHDMGVIAQVANRVCVAYAGEIVERAPVEELFDRPAHPYTRELLASLPGRTSGARLPTIEGEMPRPTGPATECRFAPRCPEAFGACERVHPREVEVGPDHTAACLLYPEGESREERLEGHQGGDDA